MDENWARAIVFLGEGAKLVGARNDELLYLGGFMGNNYNFKIGRFELCASRLNYLGYSQCDPKSDKNDSLNLGRFGHLAFWDSISECIIMFGGQRAGDNYGGNKSPILLNDILIFNHKRMNQVD